MDPATWWADSVNTLKIALGARFTVLPPDVSRLKHLRTVIVSDNALTALPAELGALTSLKVLEAENNRIAELPAEALERCVALENLRLAGNALTSVAPLANCASLVTLVVDRNPGLVSLDALEFETKERLVTLSAKKCGLASVPRGLGKCALLAEVYLTDNAIEDVPMALGELKEKKVRAIELDGNPLSDPKIKKMIGKSSNLVKELLVYVRKNGAREEGGGGDKRGGGKKGKKGKKGEEGRRVQRRGVRVRRRGRGRQGRGGGAGTGRRGEARGGGGTGEGKGGGDAPARIRTRRTRRRSASAWRACLRRSARRRSANSPSARRRRRRRRRRRSAPRRNPPPRNAPRIPPPPTTTTTTTTTTTRRF